mmetsp:Transcript_12387/g.15094  ORF Transcript_12387/g.15094 Transcript_12387/m.15094 type:complete len:167 (+) Transcript_12387:191-691(+)
MMNKDNVYDSSHVESIVRSNNHHIRLMKRKVATHFSGDLEEKKSRPNSTKSMSPLLKNKVTKNAKLKADQFKDENILIRRAGGVIFDKRKTREPLSSNIANSQEYLRKRENTTNANSELDVIKSILLREEYLQRLLDIRKKTKRRVNILSFETICNLLDMTRLEHS